jgi:hypothetical protein
MSTDRDACPMMFAKAPTLTMAQQLKAAEEGSPSRADIANNHTPTPPHQGVVGNPGPVRLKVLVRGAPDRGHHILLPLCATT